MAPASQVRETGPGEDVDDVGAPADLFVQPQLARVGSEGRQLVVDGVEVRGGVGVVVGYGVHDAVELGLHRVGVDLSKTGPGWPRSCTQAGTLVGRLRS
jgi:hypothetical protein